jgi:hypothetical protein
MSMIAALKDQSERDGIGVTVLARNLIAKGLAEGGQLNPEGLAAHVESQAHLLRELLAAEREALADVARTIEDLKKSWITAQGTHDGSIDDALKRFTEFLFSRDFGISARADQGYER